MLYNFGTLYIYVQVIFDTFFNYNCFELKKIFLQQSYNMYILSLYTGWIILMSQIYNFYPYKFHENVSDQSCFMLRERYNGDISLILNFQSQRGKDYYNFFKWDTYIRLRFRVENVEIYF